MDRPPAQCCRFRFGLRTLLAVVTLAAVASWWYAIGGAWYEKIKFEHTASQFKVGVTLENIRDALATEQRPAVTHYYPADNNKLKSVTTFRLADSIYFVCLGYSADLKSDFMEEPSNRMEIFRSPRPAQSAAPPFKDFFKYLDGNHNKTTISKYELIYSDPSVNPAGKR